MAKNNNHKAVSYNKWGYIFLIPFVVVYLIFQLVPLISTIYNSFFENYRSGLTQIGPNFVGLAKLFSAILFTSLPDLLSQSLLSNSALLCIANFVYNTHIFFYILI